MNRYMRSSLIALCLLLFAAPSDSAAAAVNIYLNIRNIPGESIDAKYPNWIVLSSYSWGMSRLGSVRNPTAPPATFNDFTFTKLMDKSSPKLYKACAAEDFISSVTLSVVKAGTNLEILQIRFTDVTISSVQPLDASPDVLPTEAVTINYSTISWIYKRQLPDGSTEITASGWDLVRNIPITPPTASASRETLKLR